MSEDLNDIQIVLGKSIELLDEYGWIQGSFGDKATGFCARGAIMEATKEVMADRDWPNYPAIHDFEVEKALGKVLPNRAHSNIAVWNDDMKPPFAKFRVKRKFRQAIKKAGAL